MGEDTEGEYDEKGSQYGEGGSDSGSYPHSKRLV